MDKFQFSAIDPDGVPRTGKIKASSQDEARRKLTSRGFRSVMLQESSPEFKVPTETHGQYRVEPAESQGYQAGLSDLMEAMTGRAYGFLLACLVLGLIAIPFTWESSDSRTSAPRSAATPSSFKLAVRGRVVGEVPPGAQAELSFPEVPYGYSLNLSELGKDGSFSAQIQFEADVTPTYLVTTVESERGKLLEKRFTLGGSTELSLGELRVRVPTD